MINKNQWRLMQWSLFLISLAIIILLFNDSLDFLPIVTEQLGRKIFWNVIIVSAPMIFLLVPGLWRNICPVGLLSVLPDHWGFSINKIPSFTTQRVLFYAGLFILLTLIPLRHIIHESIVDASLLLTIGLAAFISGIVYKGKSGWCNGLCPLLHIEKLYGIKPLTSFYNDLCNYLSSGPIVVIILEGENAVSRNRQIIGATDPLKAKEGTLRKMYGISIDKNSVHGSDSIENGKIEINFFFK